MANRRIPIPAGEPADQFAGLSARRRLPVRAPGRDLRGGAAAGLRAAQPVEFRSGTFISFHPAGVLCSGAELVRTGGSVSACGNDFLPLPVPPRGALGNRSAAGREAVHDFHCARAAQEMAGCAQSGYRRGSGYGAARLVEPYGILPEHGDRPICPAIPAGRPELHGATGTLRHPDTRMGSVPAHCGGHRVRGAQGAGHHDRDFERGCLRADRVFRVQQERVLQLLLPDNWGAGLCNRNGRREDAGHHTAAAAGALRYFCYTSAVNGGPGLLMLQSFAVFFRKLGTTAATMAERCDPYVPRVLKSKWTLAAVCLLAVALRMAEGIVFPGYEYPDEIFQLGRASCRDRA